MDGQIIAGIGNIYANEILFHAGINPNKTVGSLTEEEWQQVINHLRKTLLHAISCGGSTISDFSNANGSPGYFQMTFKVYGRTGAPCSSCGTPIKKEVLGGRATFFCCKCQKL